MRKLSITLLLAAAACGTDPTTPTASGVFPAEGFTGRALRVEISGDATTWKDGATVDFGTGVTVNAVDVASPTDLFADITIDPAAAVGKNDVTVTNGSKKYTLTKAFELVSPTAISYSGDVAQGGVPFFTIENLDFSHQFDVTTDPNTGEFLNTSIMGPAGSKFVITSATAFELQGQIFLDTNAMPGAVTIMSGKGGEISTSSAGTLDVKPRTATPFTSPQTISLAEKGSSVLYSFSGTGATLVHYTLAGTSADTSPVSEVLGSGGTWAADAIGASPAILETGGTGYILVESFGTAADTVTMAGVVEALTTGTEGSDSTNNTAGTAPTVSGIPYRQPATLSASGDVDYVKFTAPAGSTGKHLHIVTNVGADANTDTAVEVDTGAAGATVFEPNHDQESVCSFFCSNLGEDFSTSGTVTANQNYWIKVTAGSNFFASDNAYTLMFWLE